MAKPKRNAFQRHFFGLLNLAKTFVWILLAIIGVVLLGILGLFGILLFKILGILAFMILIGFTGIFLAGSFIKALK